MSAGLPSVPLESPVAPGVETDVRLRVAASSMCGITTKTNVRTTAVSAATTTAVMASGFFHAPVGASIRVTFAGPGATRRLPVMLLGYSGTPSTVTGVAWP